MITAHVSQEISIRNGGEATNWKIQFQEHERVYELGGDVLRRILQRVWEYPNTGKALDALAGVPDVELLEACRKCLKVFEELTREGHYPDMLIGNGGYKFLVDAIANAERRT